MPRKILVTTANEVQGRRITRYLGVVRGIVVRAPGIGRSLTGAFAALGGGNIREFEEVCEEARAEAHARMVDHAGERDADAIIAMRYDATDFAQGVTEVLAYGTAVRLEPGEDDDGEIARAEPVAPPPGPGEP
jgi:uncharacterized protein YbjQ (UPF0145 family)